MKILITGARGLVGGKLASYCEKIGDEVFAAGRDRLDITSRTQIDTVVSSFRPDALVNCAAYTNVDAAETNADSCDLVNNAAVKDLAELSLEYRARFVTVSTDYVFDGALERHYVESDRPIPLGEYGRSKLRGEAAAIAANPESAVVRTGWIYGDGGTNFLACIKGMLSDGREIFAIKDSYGTPTYAPDLAVRLREIAAMRFGGLIHCANSGSGTSYSGFARKVAEIGGFDESLIVERKSEDFARPAKRPKSSKLTSERYEELGLKPMPDWEDAIGRWAAY
ncbi:MAG: dTDP-4-dehydrorhamnose reductase [Pyrinomonadaceae bacterium]